MFSAKHTVQELTPVIYQATREMLDVHPHTDMSHSNRCDRLTLHMYEALSNRGHAVRRELHQSADGLWHFLLAHESIETPPSDADLVTCLNPWQYGAPARLTGPLHGERGIVQETLRVHQAPEWFISLRGVETITQVHSTQLAPGTP